MADLIHAFRNFANAPKRERQREGREREQLNYF